MLSPHHVREVSHGLLPTSLVEDDSPTWPDLQMTEYSSDEEDRRGHSSDLTPDDFDFDISSYTNQSSFFSR